MGNRPEDDGFKHKEGVIERLQAENAKLREALEKIKSYNPAWPDFYKEYARNIATEALAQEKN